MLLFSLLGLAWTHTVNLTLRDRDTVKGWFDKSGFYDRIVGSVLENVDQAGEEAGEGIPVDDPAVQQVVAEAFSPEFLRQNIEEVLDGVYGWLEGRSETPEFTVDLTPAKRRLADGLGNYAAERAATLPVCQASQMTGDFDALNATCLPPGLTPAAAGATVRQELLNNEEFLKQTVFTADDIKLENDDREISLGNVEQARLARDGYRRAGQMPIVILIIALLAAAGIVFLSGTRRTGVKRICIVMIVSGVLLGLSWLIMARISDVLSDYVATPDDGPVAARQLANDAVRVVIDDLRRPLLWYALGLTLVGAGGLIVNSVIKKKRIDHNDTPASPVPPVDDSPKVDPAASKPSPNPTVRPTPQPRPSRPSRPPRKIQL